MPLCKIPNVKENDDKVDRAPLRSFSGKDETMIMSRGPAVFLNNEHAFCLAIATRISLKPRFRTYIYRCQRVKGVLRAAGRRPINPTEKKHQK